MRILQVCAYLYPALQYGGPAKVVYDLSLELSKNNNVTVLTSDVWDEKRRIQESEKLQNSKNIGFIYTKNIINSIAYTARFFSCFGMIPYFIFRRQSFDLVHIHDVFLIPQLFVGYLAVLFKVPVILSPHGILDPVRMKKKSTLKSLLYVTLVRHLLQRTSAIIATSDKEKLDLQQLGFSNVYTVWNGIPSVNSVKKVKSQSGTTLVGLYVGKLHSQKGLIELLSVAKSFSSEQFKLILAGPDDGALVEIKSAMNNDQVVLTGYVDERKKQLLFSKADFFVYPSHAEGFSISILEALSHTLPVVITDQCNFPLVEKYEAGYICKVRDLESNLESAILDILKNRSKLKKMSKQAEKLIEDHFTISIMAKEMKRIYELAM